MIYRLSLLAGWLYATAVYADSIQLPKPRVDIGLFSQGQVSGWQQKEFKGSTDYRLVQFDQATVLQATSDQSASAFYLPARIDLKKTPVINWSWRKHKSINPGKENDKSGDDYVARLYVIKDGGIFFWKTRAINYVWSYQHTKQQVWDNPFAGSSAKMLAQRDASDPESRWFSESRNVAEDFRALHGQDIDFIDGVAIMTDSDNSGLSATALYGDIYFSAD